MRFNPEIFDTEIEREFGRLFKWTGEQTWRAKISKLQKLPRISEADVYAKHLRQRNPLLTCIQTYFDLSREGKIVARQLDDDHKRVCGYIKLLNRMVHEGGEKFAARIRGAILDDVAVKSFLFELDIAIHFLAIGYDVEFVDLAGLGQYDLLISDGKGELEVECKRKSIDAGRKIKKGDFYLLADTFFAGLRDSQKKFTVLITASSRMGADQQLFKKAADTVEKMLDSNDTHAELENLAIEIQPLPEDLEIRTNLDAARAMAPFYSGSAYYAVFSNSSTTFIVKCQSADRNEVLEAIYSEVKAGASQLSGTRPALLACLIEEVSDEDWEALREGTGLPAVATRLFSNESRRHINLLAFSSDQTPPKRHMNVVSFSMATLKFWHRDPKFPVPKKFVFPTDEAIGQEQSSQ